MLTLTQMKSLYKKARDAYYNKDTLLMSDAKFDALEDKIKRQDPTWEGLKKTGAPVKHKAKVTLAEFMPSLNKAYPEDIPRWLVKNPGQLIWMDKLDGTALQLVVKNGKAVNLHTRGNGEIGKDVSHLLPYVALPKSFGRESFVARIEGVMKKEVYEERWAAHFDNARQCVNGVFNRKEPHQALEDINLVVLGIYGLSIKDGLAWASKMGMSTVEHRDLFDKTSETLEAILKKRKTASPFEVDGLVIATSKFVLDYKDNEKPKSGIVSFKFNDSADMVEATVKKIIWQITGRGRIVPKIEITPTKIGGVMVKHAAAHNAQMMTEKGIGPEAIVRLVRSGGVIPYIDGVIKKGKFQAPDVPYRTEGVHFVVTKTSSATRTRIDVLNLVKFVTTMGIEGLKGAGLTKLAADYGMTTPVSYVKAWHEGSLVETLSAVIGRAIARKVTADFTRVFNSKVSLRKLMVATQVYGVGIGDRKLEMIEKAGYNVSKILTQYGIDDLRSRGVAGYDDKSFLLLEEGLKDAQAMVKAMRAFIKITDALPKKEALKQGLPLSGKKVAFTGYRDKVQEAMISANGGEVVPFGMSIDILLYREGGKASGKVAKAESKGIRTSTFEELL